MQAAIAATHARAPTYAATDWPEIVRLYDLLYGVHRNPVVLVNAAVAIGEACGPAPALRRLDEVPPEARSYLWHAARGEMLERLGELGQAQAAFSAAAAAAPSEPERRHLERRRWAIP